MCNCKSYNEPDIIVPKPEWSERTNDTIYLDACIADKIQELWANGIKTLASCCGHNLAPANIVIDHGQDMGIIKQIVPDWTIYEWQLIEISHPHSKDCPLFENSCRYGN